jgi:hypothetical protein
MMSSAVSIHDIRLTEIFLGARAWSFPRLPSVGKQTHVPYIAERAFASEPLQVHWHHDYHATVFTQPHSRKSVAEPPTDYRRWMHSILQVIETVSGKLKRRYSSWRPNGLRARLPICRRFFGTAENNLKLLHGFPRNRYM